MPDETMLSIGHYAHLVVLQNGVIGQLQRENAALRERVVGLEADVAALTVTETPAMPEAT